MTASIQATHPDYDLNIENWNKIDNVINGRCKEYLKNVGASESCPTYGAARQKEYEDGAILMNFTAATRNGMQGMIFMKEPTINLPTNLEYLLKNCDGNGLTLKQQAQAGVDENVRKGRGGFFVDFPTTETVPSLAQIASGEIAPYILNYSAQSIINWRTRRVGSVNKLVMVVLCESVDLSETDQVSEDYFRNVSRFQYRALMIDGEGYYFQRVYKWGDNQYHAQDDVYPLENGRKMRDIPFYFYGSENNDYQVDIAPLLSVTELNLGHYRNSADNEESIHIACQPMLVIALGENVDDAQFAKDNPEGVRISSRRGLNVGAGGNAFFIQAQETNAASNGMKEKEEKAKAIGAQLIFESAQITAESARIQQGANASVLSNVAHNVTSAMRAAITQCSRFLGVDNPDFDFSLNTDFFLSKLTAQDKAQWMSEILAGVSPKTLYYKALRRSGDYPDDWTDEDITEAVEAGGMGGQQGLL